ncbi:MAG: alpha/beta fold hydrolase [Candidatus Obscuribacterales bacterium]
MKDRVICFATDRKSESSSRRQKYYGPFRSDKLVFGSYRSIDIGEPRLEHLNGVSAFPIEPDTRVLVFVHGFNSRFDVEAKLMLELSDSIASPDTLLILYSWPSMGSPFAYMQDECSVQYSYSHFKEFLDELSRRLDDPARLHLVAHSLGCQIVYRYIMEKVDAGKGQVAGTVVMSCPDLDYQTVSRDRERQRFAASIERGFILVSDVDAPLEISRALHGYTRLGRPSLSSARSLFWGTFRTGSIPNIISTAAHAPELIARRAIGRIRNGFKDPDKLWQKENKEKGIAFADNVHLYDFTVADVKQRRLGHSVCIELISSLYRNGGPPSEWSEEEVVKMPDEFVECTILPYSRSQPYGEEEQKLFLYKRVSPPRKRGRKNPVDSA